MCKRRAFLRDGAGYSAKLTGRRQILSRSRRAAGSAGSLAPPRATCPALTGTWPGRIIVEAGIVKAASSRCAESVPRIWMKARATKTLISTARRELSSIVAMIALCPVNA